MLTVGGVGEKQAVVDGHTAVREYLSLTISVAHDIVDGAPGARFARRLIELIESGHGLGDVTATVASLRQPGLPLSISQVARARRPSAEERTALRHIGAFQDPL